MADRRRFWFITLLAAGGLSAALSLYLRSSQEQAERAGAAAAEQARRSADGLAVAQVLRALKLVTVEVRSSVASSSIDASWRGDVLAKVRAPVVYYYGVDLSSLSGEHIRIGSLTGEMTIRVPRPTRLATEVLGGDEQADVRVSWTRFREVAGEYHLGLARAGLYERARRTLLTAQETGRMEETTRAQIVALVGAICGPGIRATVEFVGPAELAGEHRDQPQPGADR